MKIVKVPNSLFRCIVGHSPLPSSLAILEKFGVAKSFIICSEIFNGPCMLDRIQVGVYGSGAHSGPLSHGPPPESYQAYMGLFNDGGETSQSVNCRTSGPRTSATVACRCSTSGSGRRCRTFTARRPTSPTRATGDGSTCVTCPPSAAPAACAPSSRSRFPLEVRLFFSLDNLPYIWHLEQYRKTFRVVSSSTSGARGNQKYDGTLRVPEWQSHYNLLNVA